jgi:hypothetical protein
MKVIVSGISIIVGQIFFCFNPLHAQFPFESTLTIVTKEKSITLANQKVDSIEQIFLENNTKTTFDTTAKWHLSYYKSRYVESILGGQGTDITKTFINKRKNDFIIGTTIFDSLPIGNVKPIIEQQTGFVDSLNPFISSPPFDLFSFSYRGEWTEVYSNSGYLKILIRTNYPNGNLTSWWQTQIYYFRKIDE